MNKVALNEWTIRDCLAQHTDKWREFTKPGYEGVSTSLGLMWMLIHCLDEDLWPQAIRIPTSPNTRVTALSYQHRPELPNGHGCSLTIFTLSLSTFCTVCKFTCTFGDPPFRAWMSPFVANRIQFYWQPSHLHGEHWNGNFLHKESFISELG